MDLQEYVYEAESFSTTSFLLETPEERQASVERYYSRVFSVKDAFIPAKRFHDWLRADLLPLDIPEGKKNLMNLPEFIWLKLVDKLRQVGVAQEHIRLLKAYFFSKPDFAAMVAEDAQDAKARQTFNALLQRPTVNPKMRQAIEDELALDTPFAAMHGLDFTLLDSLLFHLLAYQDEVGVMLWPSGHFQVWMQSLGEARTNSTHVYLSITQEVDLFRSSKLWEAKTEKLEELSAEEWQVIWAIRDSSAKEVTVNFIEKGEQRHMDITVTREEALDPKLAEELINLVKLGKYTNLSIKMQGNKTLFVERKKRKRV